MSEVYLWDSASHRIGLKFRSLGRWRHLVISQTSSSLQTLAASAALAVSAVTGMQTSAVTPHTEACSCAVQAREANSRLRRELQLLQQRREIVVGALVGSA